MARQEGLSAVEKANDRQRKTNREFAYKRVREVYPKASRSEVESLGKKLAGALDRKTIRPELEGQDAYPLLGGFENDQAVAQMPGAPAEREASRTNMPMVSPVPVNPRAIGQFPQVAESANRSFQQNVVENLPMIGGVVGAAGGLPGSVIGTGIGEGLRQSFADTKKDATLAEAGYDIGVAMASEAAFGKAFDLTAGFAARYLRGSRDVAAKNLEILRRNGFAPSLQDISDTPIIEGSRRVLGAFPLISRHYRKRLDKTKAAFDEFAEKFISDLSPDTLAMRRYVEQNSPKEAAALVRKMSESGFKGLQAGFDALNVNQKKLWDRLLFQAEVFEGMMKTVGRPFVSTMAYTSRRGAEQLKRLVDSEVIDASGKVLPQFKGTDVGEAAKFLSLESRNKATRSFTELVSLKRKVSYKLNSVRDDAEAVSLLRNFKEGIEEDIEILLRNEPTLSGLYDEANAVSEEFLTLMGELVGRRARQFRAGSPRQTLQEVTGEGGEQFYKGAGPRDPLTILRTLSENASAREIEQVGYVLKKALGETGARRVVGDALGQKLSRSLDNAVREAVERSGDATFAPQNFKKLMGLDDPTSAQFQATIEMFRQAGISPRRASDLSEIMQALFGVKNPKVSDFLMRRGVLGGAASLIGGATGGMISQGAIGPGSLLGPAAFFLVGRSFSKWATDPRRVGLVMQVADSTRAQGSRARAFVSVLNDLDNLLMTDAQTGDAAPDEIAQQRAVIKDSLAGLRNRERRRELFENLDKEFNLRDLRIRSGR